MGNRKQRLTVYGHLYDFLSLPEPFKCFYCGDPADTVDHIPPLSKIHSYRTLNLKNEVYVKVSSCVECNGLLGDSLQEDAIDRIEELKEKLTKKYKIDKVEKIWDDDEIEHAELSGILKIYIKNHSVKINYILERIEFNQGYRAYMNYFDNKFEFNVL